MRQALTRRWLSVILRCLHLSTVMLLGASLHGAPLHWPIDQLAVITLATGGAMFALDLTGRSGRWTEIAAVGVYGKLVLLGMIPLAPESATWIFWAVLLWSAFFSHAPASFRHRNLLGRG